MNETRIRIRIDEELAKKLDEYVKFLGTSRNDFIVDSIKHSLAHKVLDPLRQLKQEIKSELKEELKQEFRNPPRSE